MRKLDLLATLLLPISLQQWTPTQIGWQRLPSVTVSGESWKIKTSGNAGGWAYLFPKPENWSSSFSWTWQVQKFPSARPHFPLDKKNDDYAIRVGVLVSDGKADLPVPSRFKDQLIKRGERLSAVIFYCASNSVKSRQCAQSPYGHHIYNCLIPATSHEEIVTIKPSEDAKKLLNLDSRDDVRWIGIWAFFDSDNSNSQSDAVLSRIQVSASGD